MKIEIEVKPLQSLLNSADELALELSKIDALDQESKAAIERILADGRVTPEELDKLARSRLLVESLPQRRKDIFQMQAKLRDKLAHETQAVSSRFNGIIREAAAAKQDEVKKALAPFFEGHLRELSKRVERDFWPAVDDVRRLSNSLGSTHEPTIAFWADQGRGLLRRVTEARRRLAD